MPRLCLLLHYSWFKFDNVMNIFTKKSTNQPQTYFFVSLTLDVFCVQLLFIFVFHPFLYSCQIKLFFQTNLLLCILALLTGRLSFVTNWFKAPAALGAFLQTVMDM